MLILRILAKAMCQYYQPMTEVTDQKKFPCIILNSQSSMIKSILSISPSKQMIQLNGRPYLPTFLPIEIYPHTTESFILIGDARFELVFPKACYETLERFLFLVKIPLMRLPVLNIQEEIMNRQLCDLCHCGTHGTSHDSIIEVFFNSKTIVISKNNTRKTKDLYQTQFLTTAAALFWEHDQPFDYFFMWKKTVFFHWMTVIQSLIEEKERKKQISHIIQGQGSQQIQQCLINPISNKISEGVDESSQLSERIENQKCIFGDDMENKIVSEEKRKIIQNRKICCSIKVEDQMIDETPLKERVIFHHDERQTLEKKRVVKIQTEGVKRKLDFSQPYRKNMVQKKEGIAMMNGEIEFAQQFPEAIRQSSFPVCRPIEQDSKQISQHISNFLCCDNGRIADIRQYQVNENKVCLHEIHRENEKSQVIKQYPLRFEEEAIEPTNILFKGSNFLLNDCSWSRLFKLNAETGHIEYRNFANPIVNMDSQKGDSKVVWITEKNMGFLDLREDKYHFIAQHKAGKEFLKVKVKGSGICVGSDEGILRLFDIRYARKSLNSFNMGAGIKSISISPSQKYLVYGSQLVTCFDYFNHSLFFERSRVDDRHDVQQIQDGFPNKLLNFTHFSSIQDSIITHIDNKALFLNPQTLFVEKVHQLPRPNPDFFLEDGGNFLYRKHGHYYFHAY